MVSLSRFFYCGKDYYKIQEWREGKESNMIRKLMMIVVLFAVCACSQPQTPAPTTDEQKALYTLGVYLHRDTYQIQLTPEDYKYVQLGLADAVAGKKLATDPDANLEKLRKVVNDRREKRKAEAKAFLEKAAAEKGAKKTASGVIYKEVVAGTGAQPKAAEKVKVQYTGTFINGKEFDSTAKRGKPSEYTLGEILPCFSEGVGMMKVGGKAKFYCPPETAYGDMGNPPIIPGGSLLIYEVELLETKAATASKPDDKP